MADLLTSDFNKPKYDDLLASILVKEKSILGFLASVFSFLGRRTDFYIVSQGPNDSMGFPPGVAEELVIKVLRTYDPKMWTTQNYSQKSSNLHINDEIMCSTVAQEVEVMADEDVESNSVNAIATENITKLEAMTTNCSEDQPIPLPKYEPSNLVPLVSKLHKQDYNPPMRPLQKNSDTYNGAETETYMWSQNISELDAIFKLPMYIYKTKNLKVVIGPTDLYVEIRGGAPVIKDSFPHKIKTRDTYWSVSEGKLVIHLEKDQERWWDKLLISEKAIDLDKIDCSRPLDDLPEDHVAKVREMQWNQERKMQGLPTSDEIRNIDVLKKAWNAPGSPFAGQEFDPSILTSSSNTLGSFSGQ